MTIQETLRNYIIAERFAGQAPDNFGDDYDLIDTGAIDSLFMVGLIKFVEREYKVEFGMNDLVPRNSRSVGALADFVSRNAG